MSRKLVGAALCLAACTTADIDPMERQPKYKPYAESTLFADGRAMRQPPAGTVSREQELDRQKVEGKQASADALLERIPIPVTSELLARGRSRFDIYCAVCHGLVGDGKSVVADKMSQRLPPSLHEDRIRALTAGSVYRVITDGYGVMPSYHAELSVDDRWAVVAYVRALQRSQRAALTEAPETVRQQLQQEGAGAAPAAPQGEH